MNRLERMVPRLGARKPLLRATVAAAAATLYSVVSALPVGATDPPSGYGYGYGYGASNFLQTGLSTNTVVTAIPAGFLLGGAFLWERRRKSQNENHSPCKQQLSLRCGN